MDKAWTRGLLVAMALGVLAPGLIAQTGPTREPTLRQRLVSGLQARRPSELAFVDAVVATVERGDLPEKLVDRFFFWSRKRPQRSGGRYRPIIYFQPGLTIQAKKLGITIANDSLR